MTKAFSCTQQCHCLVSRLVGVPHGTDASARYSLVRIFPTSSSKSGAHMQREAQATLSRAHFSDLIFMWPDHSMRNAFLENRALATGSCAFCPQLFQKYRKPMEAPKIVKTQTLPWRPPGPTYACKDTMIWALPFFTRICTLWSAACTYQLLFYLRGWHDDAKTDLMTFVRNSEVCWLSVLWYRYTNLASWPWGMTLQVLFHHHLLAQLLHHTEPHLQSNVLPDPKSKGLGLEKTGHG